MNTAILRKELVLLLRQPRIFVLAGVLYSALTLMVMVRWGSIDELVNRASASRVLFYALIWLCYFLFFTFHAVQASLRIVSQEMEKGTATLLRVAPLSPLSIVLQKLLTPLATEWLIFLGTLPFISLVFVLGGVPPKEFVYQMVNLAVWLNTVVLIGLYFGTRGENASKNKRNAWATLLVISILPPIVANTLSIEWSGDNVSVLGEWLSWIALLSPIQMVRSYVPEEFTTGGPLFPALPAWIGHLLFQLLLFLGSVRNWNLLSGDTASHAGSWFGRDSRRTHSPFPLGWEAFRELESREIYRRWRLTKKWILVFVTVLTLLLVIGGPGARTLTVLPIGIATLVATVGFSSNSLRKEIDKGKSTLLFASPIHPTDVIYGKWRFYMEQGFMVWLLGFVPTLLSSLFSGAGVITWGFQGSGTTGGWLNSDVTVLLIYGSMISFVPLLSIVRLADNLRLYPRTAPYLILIGLFCCAPVGLVLLSLMVGPLLINMPVRALQRLEVSKESIRFLGWICILVGGFNVIAFFVDPPWNGYLSLVAMCFDLSLLPLASGIFLWGLACDKDENWWRTRFLPQSA